MIGVRYSRLYFIIAQSSDRQISWIGGRSIGTFPRPTPVEPGDAALNKHHDLIETHRSSASTSDAHQQLQMLNKLANDSKKSEEARKKAEEDRKKLAAEVKECKNRGNNNSGLWALIWLLTRGGRS